MSVRRRKWTDKKGRPRESWTVDVVFRHPEGRIERIQTPSPVHTRAGAERYEREVRQALLAGKYGKAAEQQQVPTLAQFEESFMQWSQNNNKPSQVYCKRHVLKNHLLPAFGRMRLDEIKLQHIEAFKAVKLKAELNPKTVNNHLGILRKALNVAIEMELIEYAPKIKALRVSRGRVSFLEFDEATRFIQAAVPEWRVFLVTALKTGLRAGELLALKWEDVDLRAGKLIVRRNVWKGIEGTPKGGREREVPLSDEAIAALSSHRHLKGPYVFCNAAGDRLTHSMLKDIVPRTCARAGLPKRLVLHDLRHTFASHLVMRRVPLAAIKELLGHTDITTTMIYAHLSPDVKRDAVKLLDAPSPHVTYAQHAGPK